MMNDLVTEILDNKSLVYYTVNRFACYLHHQDKEDLVQAAWLHIFDNIKKYDARRGKVAGYVYWTTRDAISRHYEKLNTNKRKPGMNCYEYEDTYLTSSSAEEDYIVENTLDRISTVYSTFSERQQTAFYYKFCTNTSKDDIGEMLECSRHMVDYLSLPIKKSIVGVICNE